MSAPEKIAVLITGDPVPKVLEARGDFEGIFRELLEGASSRVMDVGAGAAIFLRN